MNISCIASSSSGNCFYVENKNKAILVDAGISAGRIVERIISVGGDPKKIEGIMITHEHIDHIRGVDVLARKFQIPIFATKGTIDNSFLCSQKDLIQKIKNNETFSLANLEINTFSKSHDAADPVSFQIKNDKILSIITDAGYACENIKSAVENSDFLIMEANHDVDMLEHGPYPYHLKKRILSDKGHLSNLHAAVCVLEHAPKKLKHLILAHLSRTNNTPKLARQTFVDLLKERKDISPEMFIAKIEEPLPMIKL